MPIDHRFFEFVYPHQKVSVKNKDNDPNPKWVELHIKDPKTGEESVLLVREKEHIAIIAIGMLANLDTFEEINDVVQEARGHLRNRFLTTE